MRMTAQGAATSELAAKLSLAGATFFLVLLAVLHILKPQIHPSWQMISQYEIGPFGWVMVAKAQQTTHGTLHGLSVQAWKERYS